MNMAAIAASVAGSITYHLCKLVGPPGIGGEAGGPGPAMCRQALTPTVPRDWRFKRGEGCGVARKSTRMVPQRKETASARTEAVSQVNYQCTGDRADSRTRQTGERSAARLRGALN
jgi:hypothetical protein